MRIKITALILGAVITMQGICSSMIAVNAENTKDMNYEYNLYNQTKSAEYGKITLNLIDAHTDKPFTETNGTFQLTAKLIEGSETEEEIKSWKVTDNSTVTIENLPRDYTYTLAYSDEYHADENGIFYKYEIVTNTRFGFKKSEELNLNVYLKKCFSPDQPNAISGDVNLDSIFDIADISTFKKWLFNDSFYGDEIILNNWNAADLSKDGELDIFDFHLMKEKLLSSDEQTRIPTLEQISKMSDKEATELFSKYTFQDIECIWRKFDWYFSGLYGGGWIIEDKDISLIFNYFTQKLESVSIIPVST